MLIEQIYDEYDEDYDENTKYEMNFIIIDMSGNTLLQTTALDIYDNMENIYNIADMKNGVIGEIFK